MSKVRSILEKLDKKAEARREWQEQHPPVTFLSPQEADSRRVFTPVGKNCVECNLVCHGPYIPHKYGRLGDWIPVDAFGIEIDGYRSEDGPPYFGIVCVPEKKICLTLDSELKSKGRNL